MKQKFYLLAVMLMSCVSIMYAEDNTPDMSKAMSITVNDLDKTNFTTKGQPYSVSSAVVDGKYFTATFNNETAGGWTESRNDWVANPEGKAINFNQRAQLKRNTTVTLTIPCKGYLYIYGYCTSNNTNYFSSGLLDEQAFTVSGTKNSIPSATDESTSVNAYQTNKVIAIKSNAQLRIDSQNSMYFYGFCFVPDENIDIKVEPKPYALYDKETLTFYYDDNWLEKDNNIYFVDSGRQWWNVAETVKNVVFDPTFSNYLTNESTSNWFSNFSSLTSVSGLEYLNTQNVQNMTQMFYGCSSLTSLDLSSFDTQNVLSMSQMFYGCSSLTNLDLSSFDTQNVLSMSQMFYGCSGLTSLDVSKFNTTNVTSMAGMFYGCSKLTSLDVSKFNTQEVTSMATMFYGCSGLTSLDVSKFNTANVTSMAGMFYGCSGLTSLDVSKFNTKNATSIASMCYGCSGLSLLDLRSFSTENLTEATDLYAACSENLQVLLPDEWNIDPMTRVASLVAIGDFLYNIYKDHHATLSCRNETVTISGNMVVPSKIEYQGEEYRVTKVGRISYAAETPERNIFTKISDEEYLKVTSITFEDGIEEIDDSYLGCYVHASAINIPKSVKYISPRTYRMQSCRNMYYTEGDNQTYYLSDITFNVDQENKYYTSIKGALYDKGMKTLLRCPRNKIGEFTVPEGIESLAWGAFYSCNQLESIVLPKGLKAVGEEDATNGVFSECYRLAKINIPATVEFMSYRAFYTSKSNGLKEIYCYIKDPKGYDDDAMQLFMNYTRPTLYVPYGTINKYYDAFGWNKFETIIEMPQEIETIEEETVIAFDDKDYIVDNTPVDLNNTVINDMYISMDNKSDVNNPDGFYDSTEKCIVINKATSSDAIATAVASDLGSSDFISNYTGIVIEVNGQGSVKINAQTIGNNKLAVKIGNADAKTYTQATKGDVTINYDVTENTYVYIYAVDANNQQQSLSMDITDTSDNAVKVYSVTVTPDATAIETVASTIPAAIFGKVYSIDGKQFAQPQKGLNILKMSDGTTRKVMK